MRHLIFTVALATLIGCGSAKREGPNFRESHRPTDFLVCEEGEFDIVEIDGGQTGGGTLHLEEDYARLDFTISFIGSFEHVVEMLLPDDPSDMLNTNFTIFEYDPGFDETGDVVGDLFNIDEGYWARLKGFSALIQSQLDAGYVLTGFTVGNNTIVFLFENLADSSDTKEETLAIEYYVSTMLNDDFFADEVSAFVPCSYTPYPWE